MDSRKPLGIGTLIRNLTRVYEIVDTPNVIGKVYVLRDIHKNDVTSFAEHHLRYKLENEKGLWNVIE